MSSYAQRIERAEAKVKRERTRLAIALFAVNDRHNDVRAAEQDLAQLRRRRPRRRAR